MDDFVNCPDAVVAYANWFQFGAGQRTAWPSVESRMVLWCRAGRGRVTVNDTPHAVQVGDCLVLPWKHRVRYDADGRDPFLLAGIHVIPDHGRGRAVEFDVAHRRDSPLAGRPWRRDAAGLPMDDVIAAKLSGRPSLRHLAEYTVEAYTRRPPEEAVMRPLGVVFMAELQALARAGAPAHEEFPAPLFRVMQYVRDRIDRPVRSDELIDFSGLSWSTLARLFQRHLHSTPLDWMVEERLLRAEEMLRTSRLSVAVIGQRVGFEDAFYFSRVFKRRRGQSPMQYRRANGKL